MKRYLALSGLLTAASAACISSGNQNTINSALSSGGAGAVVQLCPGATILITDTINFSADNQEISTQGYPTDSTRATIKIAPGNTAATLIAGRNNGIKIRNIQLDGDRPNTGLQVGGGANIEIGGLSSGQVVDHVASRNPRGWSCLHVIGSGNDGNPCRNATITNNDIGPCGQEGTDAQGNGKWADGVSLDCTASLVQHNTITGSTDGGIVIFGSPGSTIDSNTITSSATEKGFGAINMVDGEYQGSYANVKVTNNVITGTKLFNLGIGIGANVWSFNDPYLLTGPATITGNTIKGSVAFPIAINGWQGGITVTGNDVSGVTTPRSNFADGSQCVPAIQTLFNNNDALVYYPAGVVGTKNLQSGFVAATGNITNFLCTSEPLPSSVSFTPNSLNIASDTGPFADLHGLIIQYQGDSNIVALDTTNPNGETPVWASGHTVASCGSPSLCHLSFQGDGNLVTYFNNTPLFSSGTAGRGAKLTALNKAPYLQIFDASGAVIWDTTKAT
ncbi:hypothetical protein F5884DRAFT_686279 [Xylogone sp. PMI_703]|nr:hypothetical protein F5884DRAFT_686279 [Xylogone sp. PMI_703]